MPVPRLLSDPPAAGQDGSLASDLVPSARSILRSELTFFVSVRVPLPRCRPVAARRWRRSVATPAPS